MSAEQPKNINLLQRAGLAVRYGRDVLTVDQYRVGDIVTTHPVYILTGAVVVGNIDAPKLIVAGLVYGFVKANEVSVEAGGQIWGDIFTPKFYLGDGGKVHGWISSPDAIGTTGTPSQNGLENDGRIPPPPELADLIPNLPSSKAMEEERSAIWHGLQTEAAEAIVARLELERSFENLVQETAGEAFSESSRLRDEVSIYQEEQAKLQDHIQKLEDQLTEQLDLNSEKSTELGALRLLLDEKNGAIEHLQSALEKQSLKVAATEMFHQELEERLLNETTRNEELAGRVANLEGALQGSLQHTAEQEEALIRWQELAEITEKKAADLENELTALEEQLKESNQVVDLLRTQRDKLQKEWEKASKDLMEVAHDRAVINAELGKKSEGGVELQQIESGAIHEQGRLNPADHETLREKVLRVEREAQEYYEQWLWTKASLDTTCSELDAMRESVTTYEEKIEVLETRIAEQETSVENWKNNVGHMSNLLYEAEAKVKELEKAVDQAKKEQVENKPRKALHQLIHKQQAQIDAYEKEVNQIHDAIDKQSRRLAEIQATLIEREIALKKTRETAERQFIELLRVKQVARGRIQRLEQEVAETKEKLERISLRAESGNEQDEN